MPADALILACLSMHGKCGAFYLLAPFVPPLPCANAMQGQGPEFSEDRIPCTQYISEWETIIQLSYPELYVTLGDFWVRLIVCRVRREA